VDQEQGQEQSEQQQVPEREVVYIKRQHRGFAAMPKKTRLALCSRGGKAAHKKGVANEWTLEEARRLGKIGGLKSQEKRRQLKEERRLAELAARQGGE